MTSLTPSHPQTPPILENGDLLSRREFERRYRAMPSVKKAELIEGIVYMASPLRFEAHAEPHANIIGWLWNYKMATPGVRLGDNPSVRLDLDNEPQPDAVLLIDRPSGGQSSLGEEGYIEGAPELIVEIAASTASIDLRDKKRVYRRNRVREYLVWQVMDRKFDWFALEGEEYISRVPDRDGIVRSGVFPGLWLAVPQLLAGEMGALMATLQAGLASPAHRAFVQQLEREGEGR
ncbi:Uma2 family endonuclease [Oxynema sp. CENA135]|uniref:Uma2 family endonuclease n=1 Tax=Oxynema sp. CENA135 TaxID=984206 RepID=UPI00190E5D3F|nr:Uma2 family endonuclease [Oxynema sp. CENA135]MBK4732722.1 Uma2 family endonuclease [Oxynema sp. CENA135]